MIEDLPIFITVIFVLTTLATVLLFFRATNHSKLILGIIILWLIIQAVVGYSGFYLVTDSIPPRFFLLVIPPLILILVTFLTTRSHLFFDGLNLKMLTWLHVIRIPVELVLWWLYQHGKLPKLMTFEGRNFDILAGLTAPFIAYFGFHKNSLGRNAILTWNFICLALLTNIVTNAVLSAPFPFQQFAFDQPNVAVLYFPFVWLPGCVVPIVLFSHMAAIRQLMRPELT